MDTLISIISNFNTVGTIIIGIFLLMIGILALKVDIEDNFHRKGARITGIVAILSGVFFIVLPLV